VDGLDSPMAERQNQGDSLPPCVLHSSRDFSTPTLLRMSEFFYIYSEFYCKVNELSLI
jgi:hypothetical protein